MAVRLKDGGQLTRPAIIDAAIEMIERDGVEALTMRKLAGKCGAAPMSLYRHVATKQDLLHAVADRYLADVEMPDVDALEWPEAIKRVIQRGGIEGDDAVPVLALLTAYATGHAQRRAERRQNRAAVEGRRAHLEELDEREFATLLAFGDRALELDSVDHFEAGLDILLDAVRRLAPA